MLECWGGGGRDARLACACGGVGSGKGQWPWCGPCSMGGAGGGRVLGTRRRRRIRKTECCNTPAEAAGKGGCALAGVAMIRLGLHAYVWDGVCESDTTTPVIG